MRWPPPGKHWSGQQCDKSANQSQFCARCGRDAVRRRFPDLSHEAVRGILSRGAERGSMSDDHRARVDNLEARMARIEARFNTYITAVETRFNAIEERLDIVDQRLSTIEAIITRLAALIGQGPPA